MKATKCADMAHGAVVIEHEPPRRSAAVRGKANPARLQTEEYAELISAEAGRVLQEYVLVAWNGKRMAAIGSIARDLAPRSGDIQPEDLSLLDAKVNALLES